MLSHLSSNINPPFPFLPSSSIANTHRNEVHLLRYRLRSCRRHGICAGRPRYYRVSELWCGFIRPSTTIKLIYDRITLTVVNWIQSECGTDAIGATGCAITDYSCMCQNGGLFSALVPCVSKKCPDRADQQSEYRQKFPTIPSSAGHAGPGAPPEFLYIATVLTDSPHPPQRCTASSKPTAPDTISYPSSPPAFLPLPLVPLPLPPVSLPLPPHQPHPRLPHQP